MLVERMIEIVVGRNLLSINRYDDISELDIAVVGLHQATESRVRGGATGLNFDHQDAFVYRKSNLVYKRVNVASADTEFRPAHFTVAHKLRHDALGNIHRNGKAYPCRRARRR